MSAGVAPPQPQFPSKNWRLGSLREVAPFLHRCNLDALPPPLKLSWSTGWCWLETAREAVQKEGAFSRFFGHLPTKTHQNPPEHTTTHQFLKCLWRLVLVGSGYQKDETYATHGSNGIFAPIFSAWRRPRITKHNQKQPNATGYMDLGFGYWEKVSFGPSKTH